MMNRFKVDRTLCINCGQCAADCPSRIIDMTDEGPVVTRPNGLKCIRCQHCLAICPKGAVSVIGIGPEECLPVQGELPEAGPFEHLIKVRRSIRSYKKEDVDPALIKKLLDTASYAPTGKNVRRVRFTVIDKRETMDKFRAAAMDLLAKRLQEGDPFPRMEAFAEHLKVWETRKADSIFRGAPHLVVSSAPKDCPTPEADCLIALSYFELLAQVNGVGTLWAGVGKWMISGVLPELRTMLGIPEDHVIGYAMAFGKPQVTYARVPKREAFETVNVSL
jgi:nitroreductase/Pyruvate/2-oxoacid:ferredoxin oxidoreductase delta subunit